MLVSPPPLAYLLAALSVTASAQQSRSVTTTHYPAVPMPGRAYTGPTAASPAVAPLFLETDAVHSSVMLVNNATQKAGATLTLRSLAGAALASKHLDLPATSQTELGVRDLLAGAAVRYGSITLTQDPDIQGIAVNAQLLIADSRNNTPAHMDEEFAKPSSQGSATLRGVADSADGPALLAVTNLADKAQTVTVRCLGASPVQAKLNIAAHATSFRPACTAPDTAEPDLLAQPDPDASASVQGYEVKGYAGPGTLAAVALAPHRRSGALVFSTVPFDDPALLKSSTAIHTGVPMGAQTVLSDGTYTPRIAVANFGMKPANVTISIAGSPDRPASETTADTDAPTPPQTRTLALAPGESRELVLADLAANAQGLLHSISISSDQPAGTVGSKVVARGDRDLFEVELPAKNSLDQDNAGGHPWSLTGDHESTLLPYNHSAQPMTLVLHVDGAGETWEKRYTLAAGETRQVSIREIESKAVKDDHGKTLGPEAQSGVVYWSASDPGKVKGRLLVSSKAEVAADNYSCGYTVVACGSSVGVLDGGFVPFEGFTDYANVNVTYCLSWGPGSCSGNMSTSSGGANVTWGLGSTNAINFNSSGDQYSYSPNLRGVGQGGTTAYYTAQENNCQSGGGGNPSPVVVMCGIPSGESTSPIRQTLQGPTAPTSTDFIQTLDLSSPPVAIAETGAAVDEAENATGSDTCYFSGSAITPQMAVTGGHWIVGSISPNAPESQVVTLESDSGVRMSSAGVVLPSAITSKIAQRSAFQSLAL